MPLVPIRLRIGFLFLEWYIRVALDTFQAVV